jgi:hypothetical protein
MLPLDDPRWTECHAEGGHAAHVPRWLRQLLNQPDNLKLFEQQRWMLCSEEVTWSAAFPAAPYFIEAARRAQRAARTEYVCFLGSIVMYRVSREEADQFTKCPLDLEPAFQGAVIAAEEMATSVLPGAKSEEAVRRLLAAVAAFKGFPGMARAILDLKHERRQEVPDEDIAF